MIEQIVNKEMIIFTLQKDTFSSYHQLKDLNNILYKANKLLRNGKALSQMALAHITQHNMIDRLTVRFLINRVDLIPPIKEICSAGLAAKGRFFRPRLPLEGSVRASIGSGAGVTQQQATTSRLLTVAVPSLASVGGFPKRSNS